MSCKICLILVSWYKSPVLSLRWRVKPLSVKRRKKEIEIPSQIVKLSLEQFLAWVNAHVCDRCRIYTAKECQSVSQFCFVLQRLPLRPYYLCSWPHCWVNIGTVLVYACVSRSVCVCVCVQAHYALKSHPAWHPLCLSEQIWSGACCHPGPCITFKEVSVRPFRQRRQPRLGLLRLPLVCQACLIRCGIKDGHFSHPVCMHVCVVLCVLLYSVSITVLERGVDERPFALHAKGVLLRGWMRLKMMEIRPVLNASDRREYEYLTFLNQRFYIFIF